MLKKELDDDYILQIKNHLNDLKFSGGVLISAGLGQSNKVVDYKLITPPSKKTSWLRQQIEDYLLLRIQQDKDIWWKNFFIKEPLPYTFFISLRDESSVDH